MCVPPPVPASLLRSPGSIQTLEDTKRKGQPGWGKREHTARRHMQPAATDPSWRKSTLAPRSNGCPAAAPGCEGRW